MEWVKMMGFDKLGLYYDIKMDGLDGECFDYSIYPDELTDEKCNEIDKAIAEYFKPYEEKDIYMGYMDIQKEDNKFFVYLDLGNVEPNYEDVAIKGILKALNNVKGIKSVVVNEGMDDFEDFEDFEDGEF